MPLLFVLFLELTVPLYTLFFVLLIVGTAIFFVKITGGHVGGNKK